MGQSSAQFSMASPSVLDAVSSDDDSAFGVQKISKARTRLLTTVPERLIEQIEDESEGDEN